MATTTTNPSSEEQVHIKVEITEETLLYDVIDPKNEEPPLPPKPPVKQKTKAAPKKAKAPKAPKAPRKKPAPHPRIEKSAQKVTKKTGKKTGGRFRERLDNLAIDMVGWSTAPTDSKLRTRNTN